ncbi:MAG: DUF488 domain-containing protein [Meiothermus sp.]|uniref:DUF488 domain-containing protein n=1 Tax=Meiothermus sp. TaxID=1955249 RepID=UPI0025CEA373|nr:DUF488 domain-containing protein [Meiothermus sp.]MCS7195145.1 DUF488 domain-containing protein [Meiothermus sp.]MCX7740729.1 DUF488 domain-containing protein [Meiothermus sp.]MDW8091863.1 DUF488 domain-containing protein [Meiothermus sp.]MDW8482132.1 DUF488 domain-containing protein [Meiothermus sp.]
MLYTIGHSSHSPERFLGLLQAHGVEALADVRSRPFSRQFPHFNAPELRALLKAVGILYVPMGRELGGQPQSAELYDSEGHADYAKMSRTEAFRSGLERLRWGMEQYRIALMCSEENPSECHRRLLVVRVLCDEDPGLCAQVFHIRGNGELQSEQELRQKEALEQPLFGEVRPWRSPKSIRSVSPARLPSSSSSF